MSEENSAFGKLEIIFSSEKAPGEGEHKLFHYIRKYGDKTESYCIYGMDADLIMLTLASQVEKFYVLREEPMSRVFENYLLDIKSVSKTLTEMMNWETSSINPTQSTQPKKNKSRIPKFNSATAINDFVFMCYLVGNDFLPHLPAIEIIEGGIDFMIDIYKDVGRVYGHLTYSTVDNVIFRPEALKCFMGSISQCEKTILETKLSHKGVYFPDPVLERNTTTNPDGTIEVNIEAYRKDYYNTNLSGVNEAKVCHDYLEGLQWVLSYYTCGVPNWKWRFPHHYAPFAYNVAEHVLDFKFPEYEPSKPIMPFIQLLSVIPPKSASLLPDALVSLLTSSESPLAKYCPTEFEVDTGGKRQKWEGIVLLPMTDYNIAENAYKNIEENIPIADRRRNILGKSYKYFVSGKTSYTFESFYGNFLCKVSTVAIDL